MDRTFTQMLAKILIQDGRCQTSSHASDGSSQLRAGARRPALVILRCQRGRKRKRRTRTSSLPSPRRARFVLFVRRRLCHHRIYEFLWNGRFTYKNRTACVPITVRIYGNWQMDSVPPATPARAREKQKEFLWRDRLVLQWE